MRIRIRHATSYRYETPASSALQLLRLTPRSHDGQFVRRWRVAVDADARLVKSEDAYGNITHLVFIEGPLEAVEIVIEGEVDTSETHGIVRGTRERQPTRLFLRETALTQPTPAIRRLARETSAAQGGTVLATLHSLNRALHQRLRFDTTATEPSTTAAEAFEAGHGVCQDFAHVLITAARTLAIPARYVSGYFLRTDTPDQEAGHAWVEAWVPDLGWVGFDPAHGESTSERYVRVAIGCDAREAAPVRGSRTGGTDETLGVALTVAEGGSRGQTQTPASISGSQNQQQSSAGSSQRQSQQQS
ncbi:MAG: transglutaminase family protein [Hyphomicrobiaceae bacterium]